jgi:hypothetical protein
LQRRFNDAAPLPFKLCKKNRGSQMPPGSRVNHLDDGVLRQPMLPEDSEPAMHVLKAGQDDQGH